MKIKTKKLLSLFVVATLPMFISSCSSANEKGSDSNINNVVKDNDFVKGVDISSYANVASNFLWEKGIVKTNNNNNTSYYEYSDFDSVKIKDNNGADTTLQNYIDNNLYSYIDENGNRKYENFFKILKYQGGVNSIRLRLWNDPYDEKGISYMGVGANDLNTDIYIMKQAIKNGITDFNLDFHYSDFWADPGHQIVPKAWKNYSTSQMEKAINDFTYNSLVKVYEETGVLPSSVQIGNEITKGFLWGSENTNYDSGKNNPKVTSKYLESGIEGVRKAQDYVNNKTNQNNYIKVAIHLESLNTSESKESILTFFDNQYLKENIDIIGLTYYPFWDYNMENFYNIISNYWTQFGKEIIFEEHSDPYTSSETGYTGDLDYKTNGNSVPTTASGQVAMLNAFLNMTLKLSPNLKTGFYYWEPGWLNFGKQSWSTQEGIDYLYPNITTNYSYGYNWSNQGLFDRNGIMLPSMKVLKNFKIKENYSYQTINVSKWVQDDIVNPLTNAWGVYNDNFVKNTTLKWNNSFVKVDISKELYRDYDGRLSNEISLLKNDTTSKLTESDAISLIKETYQRVIWHDVTFKNFQSNTNNVYTIDLNTDSSFYYYGSTTINIKIKDFESHSVDLSTNELSISKTSTNWTNQIFEFISKETSSSSTIDLGTIIWNYLGLQGGISNYENGVWLYNNTYKINRYCDWLLLKTDKLYVNSNSIKYDELLNQQYLWPSNGLGDIYSSSKQTIYFGLKIKLGTNSKSYSNDLTYLDVGKETWKYPKLLIFKLNLNLTN